MMDTISCTTIVLVLLWLSLCCQALGSLVALMEAENNAVLYSTTTLSTVLLGTCLWQCKKAGYLVSPMTWYHWVLLVLLALLQLAAVALEHRGDQRNTGNIQDTVWKYPIYGIAVVLLGILGGTLYCGWKCNLFCRPCCKGQYICYGSAIVIVLVLLVVLGVTVSLVTKSQEETSGGNIRIRIIQYLGYMAIPTTQCYTMAVLWTTTLKLPYSVPEVVSIIASFLTVASLLAVAALGRTLDHYSTKGFPLLALHLFSLGVTLYCLEYNSVFSYPKQYLCLGILAAVILVAFVAIIIISVSDGHGSMDALKYTLLGYSFLLMVPVFWYAYRCGLFKRCLPKKKGLKAIDTAENTAADTDIAKES